MKGHLLVGLLIFTAMIARAQSPIALPDPSGVTKSLAGLKGKYVLVDFWASWCLPCRKSNPELLRVYKRYRAKGFEIFGVSIDEDRTSWKKAIAQDQLPWTQVIERGWDGPVATAWKIQQVPASFLLDRQGAIVARDLTPAQLDARLTQLLK